MTTTRSEPATDPITLEIIQSSLQAISDEMFAALRKTAMSAIIYEVLDMGTGITDGEGNLASSGAGIPAFVGVLDKAVRRIMELNDPDDVRPGDIFVTNDPFYGGVTHLNDVVLAMPVFAQGELLPPGGRFTGPAIVESRGSTVVVHPRSEVAVDAYGSLVIEVG